LTLSFISVDEPITWFRAHSIDRLFRSQNKGSLPDFCYPPDMNPNLPARAEMGAGILTHR